MKPVIPYGWLLERRVKEHEWPFAEFHSDGGFRQIGYHKW